MAIAQDILLTYNTVLIKDKLLGFPANLRTLRTKVAQARQAQKDAALVVAAAEAELMFSVAEETNALGKPKYSNAETRAAALAVKRSTDPNLITADAKLRVAEMDLSEAESELQQAQDEYRSYRIVAGIVTQEIALVAHTMEVELEGENPIAPTVTATSTAGPEKEPF